MVAHLALRNSLGDGSDGSNFTGRGTSRVTKTFAGGGKKTLKRHCVCSKSFGRFGRCPSWVKLRHQAKSNSRRFLPR
jgi:hypothetical protein